MCTYHEAQYQSRHNSECNTMSLLKSTEEFAALTQLAMTLQAIFNRSFSENF